MPTIDELRETIRNSPELMALVPDTQALADALSVGRTRLRSRPIGPGTILMSFPLGEGAILLETLAMIAANAEMDPLKLSIKWAMKLLDRAELDVGLKASRDQFAVLAQYGIITDAQRDVLLSLGEEPDPASEFAVRCAIFNNDGSLAV